MIVRSKEIMLVVVLVVAAVVGSLLEHFGEPVEEKRTLAAASTYIDRGVYCPPVPQGVAANLRLVASAREPGAIEMGFEPSQGEAATLAEGEAILPDVEGGEPLDVVGFGALPAASAVTTYRSSPKGLSAALCSPTAAGEWFFPGGSSAIGFEEHIVLYNPFPDEAVVRVSFFTEGGESNKAALADVPVPSRDTASIRINKHILQRRSLGVKVEAVRGRVTAWKTVAASTKNRPEGVSSTLGATEPAHLWYFPSGAVGEGIEERISILNPSGKEALVSISIVTDEETLQPPDLMELKIPRTSEIDVKIGPGLGKKLTGSASVIVRSLNEVGIVAERSVFYGAGEAKGYASEIGASASSRSWWLGAPGTALETDAIIILNPGTDPADVSFRLSGTGLEKLGTLSEVTIEAGARLRVPLHELTGGAAAVVHLRSSAPVVAERIGYSSVQEDVSTLMGLPGAAAP